MTSKRGGMPLFSKDSLSQKRKRIFPAESRDPAAEVKRCRRRHSFEPEPELSKISHATSIDRNRQRMDPGELYRSSASTIVEIPKIGKHHDAKSDSQGAQALHFTIWKNIADIDVTGQVDDDGHRGAAVCKFLRNALCGPRPPAGLLVRLAISRQIGLRLGDDLLDRAVNKRLSPRFNIVIFIGASVGVYFFELIVILSSPPAGFARRGI